MRKLTKLTILGLALAAIPGFADPSYCDGIAGNLVQNCGFETGDFTDWTVLNNDGHTNVANSPVNSGQFSATLGTIGADATIQQNIADTAGTQYWFSFFYFTDGSVPSDFTALWDGQLELNLVDQSLQAFTQYSFVVTGTGSDTISFLARNDPGVSALDDVSVSLPEPSLPWQGLFLLLTLLGFTGLRGRTAKTVL